MGMRDRRSRPGAGFRRALAACVAALLVWCGVTLLIRVVRPAGAGPVYTVAALRAHLARDPDAWVGRIVLVRGMARPCPWWGDAARLWHCADEPLILAAEPSGALAAPLPLSQPPEGTIPAFVRGLPVLREVLARPRAVPVFTPSRFTVRLLSLAAQSCGGRSPCYGAVLLDVTPIASEVL